jgi:hypothetical protein
MPRGKFHTDQSGRKIHKLTLLKMLNERTGNGSFKYLTKCECGTEKVIGYSLMTSGRTKSCGCLQYPKGKDSPNYKHGRSQTKEYDLELHMKRAYGLDFKNYEKMLHEQGGVCAICSSPPPNNRKTRLAIDHCHKTGKVRGLLCDRCNRSIGLLKDDVSVLKSAIKYLTKE